MHGLDILRDLVLILAIAVAVVAVMRRIGIPSIAGFIVAGALIGPKALALVPESGEVEVLAEIGVALLLFGVGLELSLDRVRRLWRVVLIGGTLQVVLTALAAMTAALLFDVSLPVAVLLGLMIALSSTAIVLRGLETRGEIDAPHGRFTLGILLLQDLSVIPVLMLVPLLGTAHVGAGPALAALAKSFAVIAGVVIAARAVVPRVLRFIAATRLRELFALTIVLICMGTAWLVSSAGVPLAMGAFLAGLVVAGSEYREQALSDIVPLRETLTSLFFVSIGMLLDPRALVSNIVPVLAVLVVIIVGKALIVVLVGVILRFPLRACVLAGAALAQIGEFSFVLAQAAGAQGLWRGPLAEIIFAATVLSMLVTPVLLAAGPHLAAGTGRIRVLTRLLGVRSAGEAASDIRSLEDHLIIAGFGVAGEALARSLRRLGIRYAIVDLNSENVRRAASQGEPAFFGDVTSADVLQSLGVTRARELVLVINDPTAAARAIRTARRLAPSLAIIVRARYVGDVVPLMRAGATLVIPAELEAAAKVTACVLARHNQSQELIEREVEHIRQG